MTDTPLKILITNAWMDGRGGSEAVVRDIAIGMLARGHRPIIYSPHLGQPAQELHRRGVAMIYDLNQMAEAPDVIHGQHYIQTAEALLSFPEVPAISMVHSWTFWQERPVQFPQIHRYVATDETVRDRMVDVEGIDPGRIETLYNAIDLNRIPERPAPLPDRPRTALAFAKHKAQLPVLRAVCDQMGIKVDVLGQGGDREVADPESELVRYDLVFASARMAMEAICAGCAVVVCDARGLATMATPQDLPRLRRQNFGLRSLSRPVTVENVAGEVARYDPVQATEVSRQMRQDANLVASLDRLENLYRDAIAQVALRPVDPAARHRATMVFLRDALPRQRTDVRWPWMAEREALLAKIANLDRQLAHARAGIKSGGDIA